MPRKYREIDRWVHRMAPRLDRHARRLLEDGGLGVGNEYRLRIEPVR